VREELCWGLYFSKALFYRRISNIIWQTRKCKLHRQIWYELQVWASKGNHLLLKYM